MVQNNETSDESVNLTLIENLIRNFNLYIKQNSTLLDFFQKKNKYVNKFLYDLVKNTDPSNNLHTQNQYNVLQKTFDAFDYVVNNINDNPNISPNNKQFIEANREIIWLIYNELNSKKYGFWGSRLKDKLLEEKQQLINSGENMDTFLKEGQKPDGILLGGRKSRSNKRKLRRTKTNRVKSRRTNKRFI